MSGYPRRDLSVYAYVLKSDLTLEKHEKRKGNDNLLTALPKDFSCSKLEHADKVVRMTLERSRGEEKEMLTPCSISDWPKDELDKISKSIKDLKSQYLGAERKHMDYRDSEVQYAYAFQYYPLYIDQLSLMLDWIVKKEKSINSSASTIYEKWLMNWASKKGKSFNVAVLGPGPGPELYGLYRLISQLCVASNLPEEYIPNIHIDCIESHIQWEWLYEELTDKLIKNDKDAIFKIIKNQEKFKIEYHYADLNEPFKDQIIGGKNLNQVLKKKYDLILGQNMSNEIQGDFKIFTNNLNILIKKLKKRDGYFIVSTRGWSTNSRALSKYIEELKETERISCIIAGRKTLNTGEKWQKDIVLNNYIFNNIGKNKNEANQTIKEEVATKVRFGWNTSIESFYSQDLLSDNSKNKRQQEELSDSKRILLVFRSPFRYGNLKYAFFCPDCTNVFSLKEIKESQGKSHQELIKNKLILKNKKDDITLTNYLKSQHNLILKKPSTNKLFANFYKRTWYEQETGSIIFNCPDCYFSESIKP